MTSSVQSTAFQSSARPVDTFVAPPSVQPKTGIESLAETLAAVNPNLQKFIGTKIDEAVKDERRKGARIAIEESKSGFKDIVKTVRNQDGNDSARQLVGGSIFANDEYDKVKSELLGDTYANRIEALYQSKKYKTTTLDGKEIEVPLSHFSLDSPQAQDFLSEASGIAADITTNIKEDYVLEYFFPKQSKVIEKLVADHVKNHNEYKFNSLSKQSYSIMTSAYTQWKDGDKESAINKINQFVDGKVLLGITQDKQAKFFDQLLEYTKSLRAEAFNIDGYQGSLGVLEMMRGIKYGPNGKSIFETHPQFGNEMHKQTIDHIKDEEKLEEVLKKKKQEENEQILSQMIEDLGFDNRNINRILDFAVKVGVDRDYVLQKVEIFQPQRIQVLKDLSFDLTEGQYLGQPAAASQDLLRLLNSLGPNFTKSETAIIKTIRGQIEDGRQGQISGSKAQVDQIILRARKTMSTYDELTGLLAAVKGKDVTGAMLNFEREFKKDFETWLRYTDENGDGTFEVRTRKQIFDYLNESEIELIENINAYKQDIGSGMRGTDIRGRDDDDPQAFDEGVSIERGGPTPKASAESSVNTGELEFSGDPLNKFRGRRRGDGPGGGMMNQDAEETNSYTVKKGDTLFSLSRQFNTTVDQLKELNNINDENIIKEGQELKIKQDDAEPELNFSNDTRVQSIVKSAKELGISPIDLAAVIAQESSFRPTVVSVDKATGNKYTGLIQFGPYEIAKYNIKPNMTFEEQMVAVTSFLKDRGVKPGHGPKEIYAAIFTGNVINLTKRNSSGKLGADWPDSNGTTVNKALPNLLKGGSKYKMAIDFLQQTGTYLPKSKK